MKIAIVGGGFSGLVASASLKMAGENFTLYEREVRVGRKLLATGNGRCNISNVNIDLSRYHGSRSFAKYALEKYGKDSLISFFESIGVPCRCEDDKIFPSCMQASGVLDMLRLAEGCKEICSSSVERIIPHKKGIGVVAKGSEETFDKVIVACGGKAAKKLSGGGAYNLLTDLGHSLTPLKPSIVQLKCDGTKALEGIKVEAKVSIDSKSEEGEVLFTSYGLSGPPVMQLSRGAKGHRLSLDLAPEYDFNRVYEYLKGKTRLSYLTLENLFTGFLNKKVGMEILKRCSVYPFTKSVSEISDREIKALSSTVKNFTFDIKDTMGFDNAQVTAGGIDCKDFDDKTMESKLIKNLYCVGEMLDVDGDCGGFNLQWAFSSARACVDSILEEIKND